MMPVMEIVVPQSHAGSASIPAFLAKLWKMVDDSETNHLISWSDEGNSFIIHQQNEFAQTLLPFYYKHSNLASFVRQLNMYGFHKVIGVDSGGLKSEKQELMEFAHPFFLKGMEALLERIKRKVSSHKSGGSVHHQFAPSMQTERVNEVLSEVSGIREKQEDLDSKLDTMKRENEALWREVVNLRHKHQAQQKIVNKLIQFLISVVRPTAASMTAGNQSHQAVKRRYPHQLAIEDNNQRGVKDIRIATSHEGENGNLQEGNQGGPFISDVTNEPSPTAMSSPQALADIDVHLDNRLNDAVFEVVDPNVVNDAIVVPNSSSKRSPSPSKPSSSSRQTSSRASSSLLSPGKSGRPSLSREISREDLDQETNAMQKFLDNLRDDLSGQVTLDTNLMNFLFNPDDSNVAWPTSNAVPPLELELDQGVVRGEDKNLNNEKTSVEKNDIAVPEVSESLDDSDCCSVVNDTSAILDEHTLNTPLIFVDQEDPLIGAIKKQKK